DPRWAATARRLGGDVYHLPAFHRVHEVDGQGTAQALIAEEGKESLLHPFMLRRIDRVGSEALDRVAYDLETVNGYTGPLATTDDPAFLRGVWEGFHEWCVDRGVVAEFVRFHPLLENQRL